MKVGTFEHPKMVRLMGLLGVPLNHAGGVMERLWHWCSRYAPQGDLGKWTDAQVEESVAPELAFCTKKPSRSRVSLVDALVEAGFVDRAPEPWRLIVHDWHEHCEQRVRKYLQRNGLRFAVELMKEADKGGTVSGSCPDGVRTLSATCQDGVRPHARARHSHSHSHSHSQSDAHTSCPDTAQELLDALAAIPGYGPKMKGAAAEALAMDVVALAKELPVEVRDKAWGEFVTKSLEQGFPRPLCTLRTFLERGAPKNEGGGGGGRAGGYVATGPREQEGMVTAPDIEEGDAEARRKRREGKS